MHEKERLVIRLAEHYLTELDRGGTEASEMAKARLCGLVCEMAELGVLVPIQMVAFGWRLFDENDGDMMPGRVRPPSPEVGR